MQELRKPQTCPKCGGHEVKCILGGRPTREGLEMIAKGEAVYGSCFISFERPDWRCAACRHEWFDATDPARKELDDMLRSILDNAEIKRRKIA